MSNRKAKTTAKQVEQTVPAETPEIVEEQTVQAGSEPVAEAAVPQEDPAPESPKHPKIVVSAPQGLNLREGPHVSYAVRAVLSDGAPVEILDLPKDVEVPGWVLVGTGDGIGWVNTHFLTEAES